MKRYFLGIDIGTFESRGILIDESFRVAADASVPHGMDNPQPGWFEQEAEAVWWGDLCKLCRILIKQSGIRPEQIACVGTSALGTDCLPVDEQCRPLRPAILYGIDARASEEAAWLTEHYGQARVQELFGHPICSGDTATKILWLRRHEPEIYAKTAYFLTGSSFFDGAPDREICHRSVPCQRLVPTAVPSGRQCERGRVRAVLPPGPDRGVCMVHRHRGHGHTGGCGTDRPCRGNAGHYRYR